MPHFEEFYAGKLRGAFGAADADSVLDLTKAERDGALTAIGDMLERSRFVPPRSVAIRIAPPAGDGRETLFQPVGRALLDARRNGLILRLTPLPDHDGLGFFVQLAGKQER